MNGALAVAAAGPARNRRPKASAQERAEWAKRFAESGLGQREFCRQHGLVLMTLQRWLARVQSDAPTGTQPPLPQFAEVKLSGPVGGRWAVELCRSSGWTLRLAHDVPSSLVEQLMRLC